MSLSKQDLARKRNWFKFQITSPPFLHVDYQILTVQEKELISQIRINLDRLNKEFETHSRELGLKVPEYRCWCGKEGKYDASEKSLVVFPETKKVCFKHSK